MVLLSLSLSVRLVARLRHVSLFCRADVGAFGGSREGMIADGREASRPTGRPAGRQDTDPGPRLSILAGLCAAPRPIVGAMGDERKRVQGRLDQRRRGETRVDRGIDAARRPRRAIELSSTVESDVEVR